MQRKPIEATLLLTLFPFTSRIMLRCSMPLCINQGGHIFPKDKRRAKHWLVAIKLDDPSKLGKFARLCSDHFCEEYVAANYHIIYVQCL